MPLLRTHELTTLLTTTMTTVGLPDTSTYTTTNLISRLVAPPARSYGSAEQPSHGDWHKPHFTSLGYGTISARRLLAASVA
jgi:hypothetical protein